MLLALALFAIGVIVLAGAYVNVLDGIESVRTDRAFEQEMRWVREQVLSQSDLKELEKGGESATEDFGKIHWEVQVDPTDIADLFHVSVHVMMDGTDEKAARDGTQQFMVLRPLWSEPVDREKLRSESKERLEESRRDAGVLSKKGKK